MCLRLVEQRARWGYCQYCEDIIDVVDVSNLIDGDVVGTAEQKIKLVHNLPMRHRHTWRPMMTHRLWWTLSNINRNGSVDSTKIPPPTSSTRETSSESYDSRYSFSLSLKRTRKLEIADKDGQRRKITDGESSSLSQRDVENWSVLWCNSERRLWSCCFISLTRYKY